MGSQAVQSYEEKQPCSKNMIYELILVSKGYDSGLKHR